MTSEEFQKALADYKAELLNRGRMQGPCYVGDDETKPLVWYDQLFDRNLEPAGVINCQTPLRVGKTNNSLDVIIKACDANDGELIFPAGSTITMRFLHGDSEDGVFEDVGPTICVTAPLAGKSIEPGCEVARFSPGRFKKPWLMVNVEFSGAITGGKVDCALSYMPR